MTQSEEIFIGIDQTGAALQGGRKAKPLPISGCSWNPALDSNFELIQSPSGHHRIPHLSVDALLEWGGERLERAWRAGRVRLVLDCVLGLPTEVWGHLRSQNLSDLFRQAAHEGGETPFGRAPAERFFAGVLDEARWSSGDPLPTREPERLAGANSVFLTRPYQKNIQTGTYRLWVDLARDPRWFRESRIFPSDSQGGRGGPGNWIFEGYPSWSWTRILGAPSRDFRRAEHWIRQRGPQIQSQPGLFESYSSDADLADAAVLAFSGAYLRSRGLLWGYSGRDFREGWILGLEPKYIHI